MSRVIKACRITGEYRIKGYNLPGNKRFDRVMEQELGKRQKIKESPRVSEKTAEEKAGEIVKEAEKKAEEILSSARKEIEVEKSRAREEGYQEGYGEGLKAGQAEMKSSLTTLEEVIKGVRAELDEQTAALPAQVIKLSTRIAGRIARSGMKINPELINDIVQDMIKDMNSFQQLTVKVNPRLIPYLEQGEIQARFSGQEIQFSGDSKLEPGDCLVESEMGGRDGRLQTKLDLLEDQLLEGAGYHAGY